MMPGNYDGTRLDKEGNTDVASTSSLTNQNLGACEAKNTTPQTEKWLNKQSKSEYVLGSGKPAQPVIVFQEETQMLDLSDPDFHIAIERDYSGKFTDPMNIRFVQDYPTILQPLVSKDEFENTMETVNYLLDKGARGSTLDSILSYLTCTLLNTCRKTRMDKAMDDIAAFLYEENDRVYHPKGLHVVHPIARGLRRMVIRSIVHYGLYKHHRDLNDEGPLAP